MESRFASPTKETTPHEPTGKSRDRGELRVPALGTENLVDKVKAMK